MPSIGLAHRSTRTFIAEWTDEDVEPVDDDGLQRALETRLREAAERDVVDRPAEADRTTTEPTADGWFAGEPMF
jgi:hypothetical protein